MTKYIIKQNLPDGEKYKLTLLIMLRAKIIRKLLVILFLPFVFVSILLGLTSDSSFSEPITKYLPMLIFPSAMILILVLGPYLTIKLKKGSSLVYEFDDWGMILKNNDKTFNFPWKDITTYSELQNVFLITISSNNLNTHIIPKHEFKNFDELKEFIDFLSKKGIKRK